MKVVCVVYVQEFKDEKWIRCVGIKELGDESVLKAFTVDDDPRLIDSLWDFRIAEEEGCFTLDADDTNASKQDPDTDRDGGGPDWDGTQPLS